MIISVISIGGLCNRMRSMAGAIRLAKEWNTSVSFIWVAMPDMNAQFHHLFCDFPYHVLDLKGRGYVFRIVKALKSLNSFFGGVNIDDQFIYANIGERDERGEVYLNRIRGKNIILNTCENITNSTDFSMFRIKKRIQRLFDDKLPENIIGIHIRRTDNIKSIEFSPTELFIERMDKEIRINPYSCFYLSTDDVNEELFLTRKYGERIMKYPKRSLDRNDPRGIEDALVDLFNLSCCKRIYASYFSSFSNVAAVWGNIEKIEVKRK